MSLQPPPKQDTPSRLAGRLFGLVLLIAVAGVVIFTAVTNQRIDLIEDVRTVGLDLDDPVQVEGLTVNVADSGGAASPVVFIHDDDIAGGLTLSAVAESLGADYRTARIDLPGFGYSDRMPYQTNRHTAAGQAETVSAVLEERFATPVLVVGVGFGGEVAAELAYSYSDQVSGVVLVDVDLWSDSNSAIDSLIRLPWVGKAATYTWKTGGRFANDTWAPYCDDGGWCPSADQASLRAFIVEIEDTTVSLHEFYRTHEAALAPTHLEEITTPMAYVWSTDGSVDEDTVERTSDEIAGLTVIESDTYQAHLEDFDAIAAAVTALSS